MMLHQVILYLIMLYKCAVYDVTDMFNVCINCSDYNRPAQIISPCLSTMGTRVSCVTTGIDPAANTLKHSTVDRAVASITLRMIKRSDCSCQVQWFCRWLCSN